MKPKDQPPELASSLLAARASAAGRTLVPSGPGDSPRLIGLDSKPDFACCLERIEAWFHQAVIDRPPIRFYKHNAQFEAGEPLDRTRWTSLEQRWFDAEYQVESFERAIAGKTFLAETFPVFFPNLGPGVYSAFYGGQLEFAEVTSWYEPVLRDLEDLSALQNNPFESLYFRKLEEIMGAALERCGHQYWVGYTDYHPSLDCVAAWRGVPALCLDLRLHPEQLSPLVELSIRDFHAIFDHFHGLLQAGGQPSGTWMNLPCRGKMHIPSCDFASMISTKLFEQFSLPQLRRELHGMTHLVYHVDGRGVARHLDVILAQPEIQAIQWVQGLGKDWPILQWIPLLKRILAAGKSILVDVPLEELEDFIEQMPPEGVFLCLGVEPGQELDVLHRVQKWGSE